MSKTLTFSKISLLSYTKDPEKTVAKAAHICYSNKPFNEKIIPTIIKKVKENEHLSVLEHASFTFIIENVSRVATHQLVRHRIASYSQQSQRYTIAEDTFISPSGHDFSKFYKSAYKQYLTLIEKGVNSEDARYILPQGVGSKIIVTMNARELLHFFELRTCLRAQNEIRLVAEEMLKIVREVAPNIFIDAGPSCVKGDCPEKSYNCPRKIKKEKK